MKSRDTLIAAAKAGDNVILKNLIGSDPSLAQTKDEQGFSLVAWAANEGKADTIQVLYELGADIDDDSNENRSSPLHCAVHKEQFEAVKKLIELKANINTVNKFAATPLILAVNHEFEAISNLLLSKDADLTIPNGDGEFPLGIAVDFENIAITKLILAKRPDVNIKNKQGETPLHIAIKNNNAELVALLLEAKADVEEKNNDGNTPLLLAIKQKNIAIIRLLLNSDAKVDAKSNKLNTALHLAVETGDPKIVQLILAKKPQLNIKNSRHQAPLHIAISKSAEIVNLLLQAGADANMEDSKRRTPLHHAVMLKNQTVIDILSPLSKLNVEDFNQRRTLSITVNNADLNTLLERRDAVDYESGYYAEFFNLVQPKLEQFIANNKDRLGGKLEGCLNRVKKFAYYNSLDTAQIMDVMKKEDTITLSRGYSTHGFPILLKKNSNNTYQLMLIDRGAFAGPVVKEGNRVYTARILTPIPEDKLPAVLDLLKQADNADKSQAHEIIFNQIPALLHLQYQYDTTMLQKLFKRGQCYFENYKSLLLAEFIAAYDEQQGRMLYKEFDLYLHKEKLKEFVHYFKAVSKSNDDIQDIEKICNNLIEYKKSRLLLLAIKNDNITLIKQLISEGVNPYINDTKKHYDAYQTALIHANDEIIALLQQYKQQLTSIEVAKEAIQNPLLMVKPDELEKLATYNPFRHKALKAKMLIDNKQLKQAQEMDPLFFEHYLITGVLLCKPYIKMLKNQVTLSDAILLHAKSAENLFELARIYADGNQVQKDLLTAEALYRRALIQVQSDPSKTYPSESSIQQALSKITIEQATIWQRDKKINDSYYNKWDITQSVQQNLINLFLDYTSWSPFNWKNSNTKEITEMTVWLKSNKHEVDKMRFYLCEMRFNLLQSGVSVNDNVIKLLNFSIQQLSRSTLAVTLKPQITIQQ